MSSLDHSTKRIVWVDIAKAFGITVVFFGHIIEQMFLSYSENAHLQFKFIYSFHVPFFFVLSGFFAKKYDLGFRVFLRYKFLARIVPVIFFSLLSLPVYLLVNNNADIWQILLQVCHIFFGFPSFNFVTWFLVCLFSTEVINYFVFPYVYESRTMIILSILGFYLIGWLISDKIGYLFPILRISKLWGVQQAIMAYSFYLFGYYIFRFESLFEKIKTGKNIPVCVISAGVLCLSFDKNAGPFFHNAEQVVIMASASYGNIFLFGLSAIAGTIFIMSLARFAPESEILLFIGRNSVIFMGLNGILLYMNYYLVSLGFRYISGSTFSIFVLCSGLTVISLMISFPVAIFLKKFFPGISGTRNTSISEHSDGHG